MTRRGMQILERIANLSLEGRDVLVVCPEATADEWKMVLGVMPHRSEKVKFIEIDGDEDV